MGDLQKRMHTKKLSSVLSLAVLAVLPLVVFAAISMAGVRTLTDPLYLLAGLFILYFLLRLIYRITHFVTCIEISGDCVVVNFIFGRKKISRIKEITVQTPDSLGGLGKSRLRLAHSGGVLTISGLMDFRDYKALLFDLARFSGLKIQSAALPHGLL